jgi:hypothetical protein
MRGRTLNLLHSLERANISRVRIPPLHLRMETDPVSETQYSLVLLEYQTVGKVQELSNSESYTPSSEPFRIFQSVDTATILQDGLSKNWGSISGRSKSLLSSR